LFQCYQNNGNEFVRKFLVASAMWARDQKFAGKIWKLKTHSYVVVFKNGGGDQPLHTFMSQNTLIKQSVRV